MLGCKALSLAFALSAVITNGVSVNTAKANYSYAPVQQEVNRSSAAESNIYKEVCQEIENLVENGTLSSFHLNYYKNPYYQVPYLKFKENNSLDRNWYSKSEEQLQSIISNYSSDSREFREFIKAFHTPVEDLEQNRAIAMYFDGTMLYFLWTAPYLPFEGYNLQSLNMNGRVYKNHVVTDSCEHVNGCGSFELSYKYFSPETDLTLFMTPIGGYCLGCPTLNSESLPMYGIGMTETTFNITGFTANFDGVYYNVPYENVDSQLGTEYKTVSSDNQTFNFTKSCHEQKKSIIQSTTHCYIEITDLECQSFYSLSFGGFVHQVFFNTSLNLDNVYRVDTNYTVASDKRHWYDFTAASGSMDVAKSLTRATASGGIFGLYNYAGLNIGSYKSNEKDGVTYRYALLLNYDSDAWNFWSGTRKESDYTNVNNFRMLRMDFIYHGENYSEEIKMDPVDGVNLSIFDPTLITNTDSNLWHFKETVENIKESEPMKKIKTALFVVIGVVSAGLLIYVFSKGYRFIKNFVKK